MTGRFQPTRSAWCYALMALLLLGWAGAGMAQNSDEQDDDQGSKESKPVATPVMKSGMVNCANLIYGDGKTSECFSGGFLKQIATETHVVANEQLIPVQVDSPDLFNYPVAVMTGEGTFRLTTKQRVSMRNYLENGGFIIASAGCSSQEWQESFRRSIGEVFPEIHLKRIKPSHPVFRTVYEIDELQCKGSHKAHLEGLEIDGKIVLIFSPDGLNDTGNSGGNCCCCGGNEIKNSLQMNVNLLAYALTH